MRNREKIYKNYRKAMGVSRTTAWRHLKSVKCRSAYVKFLERKINRIKKAIKLIKKPKE